MHFNLHFDFSGIVWGMLNVALACAGFILLLIGAIAASVQRKSNTLRWALQPGHGLFTGGLIMCACGLVALLFCSCDYDMRKQLDNIAPFYVLIVTVAGIVVSMLRWKRLARELAEDQLRQPFPPRS